MVYIFGRLPRLLRRVFRLRAAESGIKARGFDRQGTGLIISGSKFSEGDELNIGSEIRIARKITGMTQEELGAKLGVSGSMISQYETGKRKPKLETVERIASVLGVDANLHRKIRSLNRHNKIDMYGKRMKEARKKAGLTQEQLAKECGFAAITIRQYEACKREPRISHLLK